MTIKEAIEKAIEGGWEDDTTFCSLEMGIHMSPQFWQALGKSLGWLEYVCNKTGKDIGKCNCDTAAYYQFERCAGKSIFGWLYHWHRMINHLADGGTIEGFFEGLG